jgi:hypothetical protein
MANLISAVRGSFLTALGGAAARQSLHAMYVNTAGGDIA